MRDQRPINGNQFLEFFQRYSTVNVNNAHYWLNLNSYSYYLDSILLPFIYPDFFLSIVQSSFKSVILIDSLSLPQDVERRSSLTPKGPPENIYYCD